MTETREGSETRRFIHGMWASVAPAWGTHAEQVDQRAAAITQRMLDGVGVHAGDRVLDLACGPGGSGLAAAERVGAGGEVVVSDIVPEMVEIARRRATARDLTNVRTEVLDLEDIAEPDRTFDVVLCREGMMFALDPARAAAEMHRVLLPTGRVAVSVWGPRRDNPWLGLLLDAIEEVTGLVVPPPGVPGPFALSDDEQLCELLTEAGFDDVAIEPVAAPLRCPSFEAWWTRQLTVAGPVVAVINGLDHATRARLHDTAHAAVSHYTTNGALELPGLALTVSAWRP